MTEARPQALAFADVSAYLDESGLEGEERRTVLDQVLVLDSKWLETWFKRQSWEA